MNNDYSISFLRNVPEWLDFGIMDWLLILMKVTNKFETQFSKFDQFDKSGFGYVCLVRIFTGIILCILGCLIIFIFMFGLINIVWWRFKNNFLNKLEEIFYALINGNFVIWYLFENYLDICICLILESFLMT